MNRYDSSITGERVRTAVLLAAGLGSRLAPFTDVVPKCMVPVSGMPILGRLIRSLDRCGFERLVVVTGYRSEVIRDYLGEGFDGVAIEYVVSPVFETTNNIYSLWLVRDLIAALGVPVPLRRIPPPPLTHGHVADDRSEGRGRAWSPS
jgi:hypothetical protein